MTPLEAVIMLLANTLRDQIENASPPSWAVVGAAAALVVRTCIAVAWRWLMRPKTLSVLARGILAKMDQPESNGDCWKMDVVGFLVGRGLAIGSGIFVANQNVTSHLSRSERRLIKRHAKEIVAQLDAQGKREAMANALRILDVSASWTKDIHPVG